MRKQILLVLNLILGCYFVQSQDVGVSGAFYANAIPENNNSTLVTLFNNNGFTTLNEAYIVVDFPVNGEYSTPTNPPTGSGAQFFDWTLNSNTWTGILNTPRPANNVDSILFTVTGVVEAPAGVPTLLFVDVINGSDNNTVNNNAAPILIVDNSALPIELESFDGYSDECGINYLEWVVSSEVNNLGFELMRSGDGDDYQTIAFIAGKGFSTQQTIYSHTDIITDNKFDGYYYKFKQIDIDGQYEFSPEVYIDSKCLDTRLKLDVFPNPAKDILNISFNTSIENELEVTLLKSDGKIIKSLNLNSKLDSYSIPLSNVATGVYYVRVTTNGYTDTRKIMVVK